MEPPEAVNDGTEEPEQDQRSVLIHVKITIASLVPGCSDNVQSFDQAAQRLEVLEAMHVFSADVLARGSHAPHYANRDGSAQLPLFAPIYRDCLAQISCRTGVTLSYLLRGLINH